MRLVILDEAAREFSESVAYYEAKEAGLGWRFRTEVAEAVAWIERNPELSRARPKGYRRHNLHAFPHRNRTRASATGVLAGTNLSGV
ncbi:MAG: hypothetical protein ACR2MW_06005 [Chthoniobacterales bacterium]